MQFKAVVLNLDKRKDRLEEVTFQLNREKIEFERFAGIEDEIGWVGFNKSILAVFKKYKDVENLFLFEDDCYFEKYFNRDVLQELPSDYDAFWLGANLQSFHEKRYSKNLSVLENAWTTHAVLYSKRFRDWVLENWDGKLIFDEWMRVNAQPIRKCFVIRPMIAFQKSTESDIQGKYVNLKEVWDASKSRLF